MVEAPMNPWLSVWTRPRETIRRIIETDPTRSWLLVAALAGVANALDRASGRNAGDKLPLPTIIAGAVGLGAVWGVVSVYLGAFLLALTGRWIGGRGSRAELRAAVAWAQVPVALSLLLWVPELALVGREMFTAETPELDDNPAAAIGLFLFGLAELTLGVWSLVLLLKCVGEVQGFSAWKALGNLLLAGLILFVPLTLAVVAVVALR